MTWLASHNLKYGRNRYTTFTLELHSHAVHTLALFLPIGDLAKKCCRWRLGTVEISSQVTLWRLIKWQRHSTEEIRALLVVEAW